MDLRKKKLLKVLSESKVILELKDLSKILNISTSTVKRAIKKYKLTYLWKINKNLGKKSIFRNPIKQCPICLKLKNRILDFRYNHRGPKGWCKHCHWSKRMSAINATKSRKWNEYRTIWETTNNDTIPKGWHIHHLDNDHTNNDPDNLICVSPEMHLEIHEIMFLKYGLQRDKIAADLLRTGISS